MAKTPAAKTASKKTAAAALKPATKSAAKPAIAPRAKSAFGIHTDLVRAIAQLLNETNVGEIQVAKGDLPHGSVGYQTIFAAGLTLFLLTLVFNLAGFWLRRRYREVY